MHCGYPKRRGSSSSTWLKGTILETTKIGKTMRSTQLRAAYASIGVWWIAAICAFPSTRCRSRPSAPIRRRMATPSSAVVTFPTSCRHLAIGPTLPQTPTRLRYRRWKMSPRSAGRLEAVNQTRPEPPSSRHWKSPSLRLILGKAERLLRRLTGCNASAASLGPAKPSCWRSRRLTYTRSIPSGASQSRSTHGL